MVVPYQFYNRYLFAYRMIAAYSRLLDRFPLTTKSLTSGLLFSLGDIVTQKRTHAIT